MYSRRHVDILDLASKYRLLNTRNLGKKALHSPFKGIIMRKAFFLALNSSFARLWVIQSRYLGKPLAPQNT